MDLALILEDIQLDQMKQGETFLFMKCTLVTKSHSLIKMMILKNTH